MFVDLRKSSFLFLIAAICVLLACVSSESSRIALRQLPTPILRVRGGGQRNIDIRATTIAGDCVESNEQSKCTEDLRTNHQDVSLQRNATDKALKNYQYYF